MNADAEPLSISNRSGRTPSLVQFAVPTTAIEHLLRTRPWVRLVSAMLWIGALMMLGTGVGFVALGSLRDRFLPAPPGLPAWVAFLVAGLYILIACLYMYPAAKLWSYGTRIARLAASQHPIDLDRALDAQRAFWTFCGVMTLIVLTGYVLLMLGFVLVALRIIPVGPGLVPR